MLLCYSQLSLYHCTELKIKYNAISFISFKMMKLWLRQIWYIKVTCTFSTSDCLWWSCPIKFFKNLHTKETQQVLMCFVWDISRTSTLEKHGEIVKKNLFSIVNKMLDDCYFALIKITFVMLFSVYAVWGHSQGYSLLSCWIL